MHFRRITRSDFPLVGEWLARPHVHRWWNEDHSLDHLEQEFGPGIDGAQRFFGYLASDDDLHDPFGLIQLYPIDDYPAYVEAFDDVYPVTARCWSIDYFIGEPDLVGRGVGRRMVRAFVDLVWSTYEEPSSLVVPVNAANEASWRMLLGAGFEVVARGEMEPDNPIDGRSHHILRLDRPSSPAPSSEACAERRTSPRSERTHYG